MIVGDIQSNCQQKLGLNHPWSGSRAVLSKKYQGMTNGLLHTDQMVTWRYGFRSHLDDSYQSSRKYSCMCCFAQSVYDQQECLLFIMNGTSIKLIFLHYKTPHRCSAIDFTANFSLGKNGPFFHSGAIHWIVSLHGRTVRSAWMSLCQLIRPRRDLGWRDLELNEWLGLHWISPIWEVYIFMIYYIILVLIYIYIICM